MRVCQRLGKTLAQCQREMGSREFTLWRAWLDHEFEVSREKWEYYAAAFLCQNAGGGPVNRHLLRFSTAALSPQKRMEMSKAFWKTKIRMANRNATARKGMK